MLLPRPELEAQLQRFGPVYDNHYRTRLLRRLGFEADLAGVAELPDLLPPTLQLLADWEVGYGAFFAALAARVRLGGLPETAADLAPFVASAAAPARSSWLAWRDAWWLWSQYLDGQDGANALAIGVSLQRWNLVQTPVRPLIEQLWAAIEHHDDWQPLADWLAATRQEFSARDR